MGTGLRADHLKVFAKLRRRGILAAKGKSCYAGVHCRFHLVPVDVCGGIRYSRAWQVLWHER